MGKRACRVTAHAKYGTTKVKICWLKLDSAHCSNITAEYVYWEAQVLVANKEAIIVVCVQCIHL